MMDTKISLDYVQDKSINGLVQAKAYALRFNKSEIITFFDDDIALEKISKNINKEFVKKKK